jgi:lipoprotein-releasing system permease protein
MYKILLPLHYFFRRPISILAVAAITLCVFTVVVVMTVMSGLVGDFKEKNHQFVGDCIVSADSLVGFAHYENFKTILNEQDYIFATSAVVKGYGLLAPVGMDRNYSVEIIGINIEDHIKATSFGQALHYHKDDPLNAFVPEYNPMAPGCIIGIDMVLDTRDRAGKYYQVPNIPKIESKVTGFPLTAKGALAKLGTDVVSSKNFVYSDNSYSGLVKVDQKAIHLPFEEARQLFQLSSNNPRVNAIYIKFRDGVNVDAGTAKVTKLWQDYTESAKDLKYANLFENVTVQSWKMYRREIIGPMERERTMLMFAFFMLGIINVFIILVVFYMIISHKSKDIGVLKSVGISTCNVIQIFLNFAILIGLAGSAIGASAGCLFLMKVTDIENWLFTKYGWEVWDRNFFAIGEIPHDIDAKVISVIVLAAVGAALIGAFIPAMQAARRKPAEILQVDQL